MSWPDSHSLWEFVPGFGRSRAEPTEAAVCWVVAGFLPREAWRCHQGCTITQLPWASQISLLKRGERERACWVCEPVWDIFLLEEKVSRCSRWYEQCQAGITSSGVPGCLSTGLCSTETTSYQSFPLPACISKPQTRPPAPAMGLRCSSAVARGCLSLW